MKEGAAQAARNALAAEASPYLQQHAANPVDWLPWGREAFEKAKALDRPVFLSVGYSTCHWCHVMARESFENPETAEILNREFVSVKVDREERPDVDRLYMGFVQASTGSGGWPMSVWLTPDGEPFYGGTYFPPADRYGRMGFPRLLLALADVWKTRREEVVRQGAEALAALAAPAGVDGAELEIDGALWQFEQSFDAVWGGFGGAPKFPRPAVFSLLFLGSERHRAMAVQTLRHMSRGGMRDALGGGFHRYSVDKYWHVPHFEKMLYDQAQLATSCLHAWQLTGEDFFRDTAESTLDYVLRDLRVPQGGFYSAEDADSGTPGRPDEHEEGAFYVWEESEIRRLLDPGEARAFCDFYSVKPSGNAPEGSDPHGEFAGRNILHESGNRDGLPGDAKQRAALAAARALLLAERGRRPRPSRDEKVLTAWNGLMISALARAGLAFGEARYTKAAREAAEFLRGGLFRDGRLLRSWCAGHASVPAFSEDHAFLAAGLIDLYEATGEFAWLDWAAVLQRQLDTEFWDGGSGGYFTDSGADPLLKARTKGDHDGAEPLADSIAALNLLRLERAGFRMGRRPDEIFEAWSGQAARHPSAFPALLAAWHISRKNHRQAVIAGTPGAAAVRSMATAVGRAFAPGLAILYADGGVGQKHLSVSHPEVGGMTAGPDGAALFLCENYSCRAPVFDPSAVPDLTEPARG